MKQGMNDLIAQYKKKKRVFSVWIRIGFYVILFLVYLCRPSNTALTMCGSECAFYTGEPFADLFCTNE